MPEGSSLPPNVQKWVDALRSGNYVRTTTNLRTDDRFCCLGVACDISKLGTWEAGTYIISETGYGESRVLPDEVREWLGLTDDVGSIRDIQYGLCINSLIVLNDALNWDFKTIADFIESNWDRIKQEHNDDETPQASH